MKKIIKNESETKKLGERIAKEFSGGDIILLYGELGAGKTTFVKGIAEYFNIKDNITSPTFTLMNIYDVKSNDKIKQLVHIDTYRLKSEKELIEIGVEDYLNDNSSICIIEWPEKILGLVKNRKIKKIKISHINDNKRMIEIK